MLDNEVGAGRRRRVRVRTAGATLVAGAVAAVGAVAVQIWDRPDDGGTVAGPGPDASSTQGEPDMAEAFETTRSVVDPLLAVNDSRYQEEQFHLALNHETGQAILYLPHTGTIDPEETGPIDVDQLAADAIAAAQATPGAAPVVPVIGVALIDELDAVSAQLFASRAEWATDAADVYWTIAKPNTVSVGVGVAEPEVAANLPETVQLPSGATATIRTERPGRLASNNTASVDGLAVASLTPALRRVGPRSRLRRRTGRRGLVVVAAALAGRVVRPRLA